MATSPSFSAPFINVCDKELNKKDFYAVYDRIKPLSAGWKQIAISWHLEIDTINRIEADCRGYTISCLQKVIEYWLKKDYDYESHGIPCWRRVCVAVKDGGGDPALADEIARNHPLTATTGGATPHPLPATTGGATPYSVGGPTDVIHNEGMSPLGGGNSSDNENWPAVAIRDVSPNDTVMSPGSGKSNNSRVYAHPEINFPLTNEIHELQDEFADTLQLTMESFENKPDLLPKVIDYLERRVHALLGPIKKNNPAAVQAVKEEFKDIKTIIELFSTLQDKYISWFNYELIVKLVHVFLKDNRTLKRTWSAYEDKLKDYFINSGGLLKDADAVQFGVKGVPPGTRVMIAKVDRDDYTLNDIFFYRRAIPKGLDVPEMRLYFSVVTPGSLQFEHLIPEYLYSLLFPLTTKLQQQLASIGITELTCGEDKYDLREFLTEKVQYLSTDIDICDPLWYENTSTPLHEAAWRGLKDEVQWLLNKFGYSTYHRGLHGWTPLLSASYGGHIEILQLLIHQYGIDPNEGDDNSVSSIHMASYKGHLSIVQYLVDTCHIPPDQPDNSNNTALLYSAMGGHSDLVDFFIERNCNTSQINFMRASLSLLACKSGELALVHKLESLNLFSPNDISISGAGILHYICQSNSINNKSVELFKYLLNRYQLPIDVKDQYGRTPLHIASWYASSSVVEYIVSIQGNEALLVTDNNGYSCLHHACHAAIQIPGGIVYSKLHAQSDTPVIRIINSARIKQNINFMKRNERVNMFSSLLKKANTCPNFDINATSNYDGMSLLHLASLSGSTLLVKALEKYDINCTLTIDGKSPVHCATSSGSTSVLSYILFQYNLNANDADTDGRIPLTGCCRSGSINSVKYLINNHNSDPNITDDFDGMTCLHCSCRNGHIDITQYLVEVQHCDITKTDNEGRTLVHHAAWSGNFDLVQYLITEQGLSPTAVDKNGLTALHYASWSLNLSLVKELITTYQLDPHQADSNGNLPIHYAAQTGNILLLELYVKAYKCSLSLTNNIGWNISHYSFSNGHIHFIKHLIENHQLSLSGAVYISVVRGHLNVLKYLIDNNYCNPNATDDEGWTLLHAAVAVNKYKILEYLLSKSIPSMSVVWLCEIKCLFDSPHDIYNNPHNAVLINVQDKDGNTPLHVACQSGRQNMVSLLLKASLSNNNLLITNKKGQTPLHLAVASGHKDTAEALLFSVTGSSTHHDLLTATDNEGSTVLHTACINGHINVFRYLSSIYPQSVNVLDNRGRGLLHAACEGGDIGIVRTLIETHGLDALAEDKDGITCLHLLAERKRVYIYQYLEPNIVSNPVPKDKSGRTPLHYASRSDNIRMVRYLIETFPCTPDDPDNNGYTSVHRACEAGSMELVQYFLTDLKCNALAETDERKTMLYFASKSSNLELVLFLIDVFSLKPRPHDIEIAQSVSPDSSVVKYLQEIHYDLFLLEQSKVSGYHEKLEGQQVDPPGQNIVS
uniref:Uncharacterized protein n=1 Tax=Amphimedon queenslandica TaxID=400682 RepID=A0A1X7TKZ4_AMPQE